MLDRDWINQLIESIRTWQLRAIFNSDINGTLKKRLHFKGDNPLRHCLSNNGH